MSWGHALKNPGENSGNIMISLHHHWFYQRTLNFTFIIIIIPLGSQCLVWINPTHILESSNISRIFSEKKKPRPFRRNHPFMDGEVSATRFLRSGACSEMHKPAWRRSIKPRCVWKPPKTKKTLAKSRQKQGNCHEVAHEQWRYIGDELLPNYVGIMINHYWVSKHILI